MSQKYLIKVILQKNRRYSTELLFQEFNVLNIDLLYTKSILIFTFKHKSLLRTNVEHNHITRHKINVNINIPQYTHSTTQRFIAYYGPKFYNLLPINFKQINNIGLFSKKITKYITENAPKFLNILSS